MMRTRVRRNDGGTKCWGENNFGLLGLGDNASRGDGPGEMGDALPFVNLGTGRSARGFAGGGTHTCALLDNDPIKCWGHNISGKLGVGDTASRGDNPSEMGDALPTADVGN